MPEIIIRLEGQNEIPQDWKLGKNFLNAEIYIKRLGDRGFDDGTIAFLLSFGVGVASGVVANWLYSILNKTKHKTVYINQLTVNVDQKSIESAIDEEIAILEAKGEKSSKN